MKTAFLAALCGALCVAAATAAMTEIQGHPTFIEGTSAWKHVGAAPLDRLQPLLFAVRQNTEHLEKELMKVSDPVRTAAVQHRVPCAGCGMPHVADPPFLPVSIATSAFPPLRPAQDHG